ncbi:MAG: hypothetical protein WD336_03090 [Trueperaceae bacterium]
MRIRMRPIWMGLLGLVLALGLAACGTAGSGDGNGGGDGGGDGTAPTSDAAIERGSTMFGDASASFSAAQSDPDFQASSTILTSAFVEVPLPGMTALGPAATDALETLGIEVASSHSGPEGHYEWNPSTGSWDVTGPAQGGADASFEYPDVIGDGRDAFLFMSYTEATFNVSSGDHTFLTALNVDVELGGAAVADLTMTSSYDVVTSRCESSETALEVASFDLAANVADASMSMDMATDGSGTSGSLTVSYDTDSATMSFSTDTRYQFAHETTCPEAEFGEPTEMSFSVDTTTASDSAVFSVDLTSIAWATGSTTAERYIASFDVDVSWTFSGTDAITATGSVQLDETGGMVDNDVMVDFGDGAMPLDDVIKDFEGEPTAF